MKVKVTRQDIRSGRNDAGRICGCPIWHALRRRLRIPSESLEVPNVSWAKFGRIFIQLPQEAVEFQEALMEDPYAKVKPFEFETKIEVEGE